jgi:hypothetical protein
MIISLQSCQRDNAESPPFEAAAMHAVGKQQTKEIKYQLHAVCAGRAHAPAQKGGIVMSRKCG